MLCARISAREPISAHVDLGVEIKSGVIRCVTEDGRLSDSQAPEELKMSGTRPRLHGKAASEPIVNPITVQPGDSLAPQSD
eukprot:4205042-Amphidinium_carterae.1